MNILFFHADISKSSGGIYQYSLTILQSILEANLNKPTVYLYASLQDENIINIAKSFENVFLIPKRLLIEPVINKFYRNTCALINVLLAQLKVKGRLSERSYIAHLISRYNIDILYSPFQSFPSGIKIPAIATMHDLQELRFPEYFTPEERVQRALSRQKVISNACSIVVSFQHIKDDIAKYFPDCSSKIFVMPIRLSKQWVKLFEHKNVYSNRLSTILPERYVLYPAATWEHKNHKNLIHAIAKLKRSGKLDFKVVCTGNLTSYSTYLQKIIEEQSLENDITFLGIVTDEELVYCYRNTQAVVIPTKYEAGSFPVMESIYLGVPVICSNVTSLPETIGSTKFTFNPDNISELADQIFKIVNDDHFRKQNTSLIKQQKKKLETIDNANILKTIFEYVQKETTKK